MKSALLVLSFILVFPSLQVCHASFAKDYKQSYADSDQQEKAFVALREVERRLANLVNQSSNVGKVAGEMIRLIDFARNNDFINDESKSEACIDHRQKGTFAGFQELLDGNQRKKFEVEYLQTQYNTHFTVSINYPDVYKSTNFFGQNSKQFKVTLCFFECGSIRLLIGVGETKIDGDGICQEITRVWNLDDIKGEHNWDTGFSEYYTKYLYP